ncbi:hypothetical protein ACFWEY_36675, partial [Streptomyces nigra]
MAWERAQAIVGGGDQGWKSAQADRLPPEGQLLRRIALDLYHAADDQVEQVTQPAQPPVTREYSPQDALEQLTLAAEEHQHAINRFHAVEDRVERVTQQWKKILDQEKSGQRFRPVVYEPQPSSSGWSGSGVSRGLPGGGGLPGGQVTGKPGSAGGHGAGAE